MLVELVTGDHCLVEVRQQLDELYRDPSYRTHMSASHLDFLVAPKDTWHGDIFLVYDDTGVGGPRTPVGLMRPRLDRAERIVTNILPTVFKTQRGKGYSSFMFAWCIDNYFNQGFHKICTCVWGINAASLALNRKFLFEEAVRPQHQFIDGVYYDSHLFGLLKSDYLSNRDNKKSVVDQTLARELTSNGD